jgi:hypothetical protein
MCKGTKESEVQEKVCNVSNNILVSQHCKEYLTHDDLSFPYKLQLSQPPSNDGTARRYAFAREYTALLEDNQGVLNVARFSNEAYFHLDGHIKKQNVPF